MKVSPASSITLPATEAMDSSFDFKLLLAQAGALARLSFWRLFNTKAFWSTLLMATLPVLITMLISAIVFLKHGLEGAPHLTPGDMLKLLEPLFLGGYLHLGLFLSAATFGSQALRDELEAQTLHFFFLQSAPRWLLLPCKFAAYLAFAIPVFVMSLLAIHVLLIVPYGWDVSSELYFSASYLKSFAAQIAVVGVALVVFGALTAAISGFIRNLFYVFAIYGWELMTSFLPDSMKAFSLTYHLKALLPFNASARTGIIGIPSEAPGAVQVILVLGLTCIVSLAVSAWWSGRKECLYTV